MSAPPIRVSVRAAIIREDKVLLVECDQAPFGVHYNYPGGGVDYGESLTDALLREVWEETRAEIAILHLLHIWELVPDITAHDRQQQEVSFLFRCVLKEGNEPRMPDTPDTFQTDVRWVPLSELSSLPLLPTISPVLFAALRDSRTVEVICETLHFDVAPHGETMST